MRKQDDVRQVAFKCECEGTGYIAVVDRLGDDVEYVECAKHHPAYQDPAN
jgi:hypothetical protein